MTTQEQWNCPEDGETNTYNLGIQPIKCKFQHTQKEQPFDNNKLHPTFKSKVTVQSPEMSSFTQGFARSEKGLKISGVTLNLNQSRPDQSNNIAGDTNLIFLGSAECSKNVEDCSEGGATGRGYGGKMTFQANGMVGTDKEQRTTKEKHV